MVYLTTLLLTLALLLRLANYPNSRSFLDPFVLFITPQIISLSIILSLPFFGLSIKNDLSELTLLYVLALSTSFLVGVTFYDNVKLSNNKFLGEEIVNSKSQSLFFDFAFYTTFLISLFGTAKLLSGLGVFSFLDLVALYSSDFNYIEKNFFNSSYAILWQACFASLFFYNFTRFKRINLIIVFFLFLMIFFRGAFIYIIIGFFYFIVPRWVLTRHGKFLNKLLTLLFFFFLLNLIVYFSYEDLSLFKYILKIFPYTAGNYVNLAYHVESLTNNADIFSFSHFFESLGFGSVMFYFDKYFYLSYSPSLIFPFLQQIENFHVYGNTATVYGSFLGVNILISSLYFILLGLIGSYLYHNAKYSMFILVVLCWFSASHFLSFATGGHFITTRFFPALLFIFPFLFLYELLRKK
jgi:hypothetical protein